MHVNKQQAIMHYINNLHHELFVVLRYTSELTTNKMFQYLQDKARTRNLHCYPSYRGRVKRH